MQPSALFMPIGLRALDPVFPQSGKLACFKLFRLESGHNELVFQSAIPGHYLWSFELLFSII